MANWSNKVIYIGVTNDLRRRIYEHKQKIIKGFTQKYNVNKLIYFETFQDVRMAIARKKEVKKWGREKKNKLVKLKNPEWRDLSFDFE